MRDPADLFRLPLAAIVGAPRCGTTTLSRWLTAHPDVAFSRPKEPHFFTLHDLTGCDDAELRETVAGHYLGRYFRDADPAAKLLAEGSVSYLYGPERLTPLLRLWPEAKFIVSLRDPMRLLPSLHQRNLVQGDETVADFATAWRLRGRRAEGKDVPRSCLDARVLQYEEAGRLGTRLQQLFDVVGRERCHVILFDDIEADPDAVHAALLDFLDLAPRPRPNLPPRRASAGYRIAWLQRLLKRPPVARTVLAGDKFRQRVTQKPHREAGTAAKAVMRLRKRLLDWNRAPAPKSVVPPEVAAEIREKLMPDISRLGALIGRDLGHWLAVPDPADSSPKPRR